MRIPSMILAAVPAILCGLAPASSAADEYIYLSAAGFHGSIGDTSYGLATGVLVCEQRPLRPIAWFGAVKPTDGKSRFLYLLIFKTPTDFDASSSMTFSVDGHGSSNRGAEGTAVAQLAKKKIEVGYNFATDPKTHAVLKQSLTVGGQEVKEAEPRVFVVDLTGETVTYRPVKVELPTEAPDVSEARNDNWGPAVRRAVEQLKKDSPELKRLLESGTK